MNTHERLQAFTQKYGMTLQDLYLLNPHLKLIVEFLVLELDYLNEKVEDKKTDTTDYGYWSF